LIGKTVGHYVITARLGAGGMGEVYLAQDTRLERKAAIKFLPAEMAADPDRRQRFLHEARAASALNHPHVCVVYDVGESDDGRPFIAMEFVEGRTLDAEVRQGSLKVTGIVEIGMQVADALDAAHERRIVHRDIKPTNICVSERGQVKVLDFGLAKTLPTGTIGHELTQTQVGQVVGTPHYMSPEQLLGYEFDQRSDNFSLGIVLYELITGQRPFNGANSNEIGEKIVHAQPVAIARLNYDVPPELERITLKCLQKQPERRYQSARELMVDLKNLGRLLDSGQNLDTAYDLSGPQLAARAMPDAASGVYQSAIGAPVDIDPQVLARSDVVISYASLDDRPSTPGRPGWISQFHQNLHVRVAQLSGKQVAVVKYSDGNAAADVEAKALKQIPSAGRQISQRLVRHRNGVQCVAASPRAERFATGADDHCVFDWNLSTHRPVAGWSETEKQYVLSLAYSPDGSLLATGTGYPLHCVRCRGPAAGQWRSQWSRVPLGFGDRGKTAGTSDGTVLGLVDRVPG